MTHDDEIRYCLVSYAPHMLRDEAVNIAIVVARGDAVSVRFAEDWQERVRALDPRADIAVLESLRSELKSRDRAAELLPTMEDSFSNAIRLSPWKGCLTRDPEKETENLAAQYL